MLVAVEYRGANVTFAQRPYRCMPDGQSLDAFRGIVESLESQPGDDAVIYEGALQRLTEQTLCGSDSHTVQTATAQRTPCRASLSGGGEVHARIKVYRRGSTLQGAWIVLTPLDVIARVTGTCRSGERHVMQEAYAERTAMEIAVPPDGLVPGRYLGEPAPGSGARWVLTVAALGYPGPTS